jgi:hypothetical protein
MFNNSARDYARRAGAGARDEAKAVGVMFNTTRGYAPKSRSTRGPRASASMLASATPGIAARRWRSGADEMFSVDEPAQSLVDDRKNASSPVWHRR